jgi:MFS family permease
LIVQRRRRRADATVLLSGPLPSGAGVGGPLGGWIADTLGWRAAFLLQAPLVIAALFILWLKIREPPNVIEAMRAASGKKWARIDALGSFTLVVAVGGLLLGFSFQTEGATWADFKVWGLLVIRCASVSSPADLHAALTLASILSAVFTALFVFVELRAVEPVLPFSMLKRRTPLFVAIVRLSLLVLSLWSIKLTHLSCAIRTTSFLPSSPSPSSVSSSF